jgi:peptide/nickel transport system permease protein
MTAVTDVDAAGIEPVPTAIRPRPFDLLRRALAYPGGKIGAALILLVVGIAVLGPFLAGGSTTEPVSLPFESPSSERLLGTDFLGRDALARFLNGGHSILLLATLATVMTYAIGVPIGMFIGFWRSWPDAVSLGVVDLMLSFPPVIFALLLLGAVGPKTWAVVVGIAATAAPRVIRVVRAATIDSVSQEYLEAAMLRGESTPTILRRELLPNLWTPIVADFGIRLTGAFLLASALGYLGFGLTPPEPNWGVMLSENRLGLTFAPLTVLAPAIAIALFAIGVNLLTDSMARALGRSVLTRDV